jgi:AcrR family transcriptional regulator
VSDEVLDRFVQRALSRREATYGNEIRRLMDAALTLMIRGGTSASPPVNDIIAEAGVSKDAFYRYFPSKGALIGALLEDGALRLRGYLAHQMAKESDPERQVRRWVEGVLTQAVGEAATTTRAVLASASGADGGPLLGRHFASGPLASLLHEPFAALGSPAPRVDAALAAHGTLGFVADHVSAGTTPSEEEAERLIEFYLAAARGPSTASHTDAES